MVDELIKTSSFEKSRPSNKPHGWLDDNGKDNWEYYKTYIQDKNNTIWEATLNVAITADGEKVLYDIDPIKKVGRSVKSDTLLTDRYTTTPSAKSQEEISRNSDRNQNSDAAPVWYSQMSRVIDGIKTEKVGADSVIPYLRGRGVKAEEIKWSGIAAFLQGKKSVTKDDLQRFAENSMLRMEEKMLDTEYDSNVFEQYQAANDEAWNRGYKALREDGVEIDEDKLTVEYEDDVVIIGRVGGRVRAMSAQARLRGGHG